jgi:AraC family ethanolamine operon transcriptional activator
MNRRVYADFDEFADCISGIAGRFVPTARSTGEWWIERVRMDGFDVQHLQIGGATTFAGDGVTGTLSIGIPVTDAADVRVDGRRLADDAFVLLRKDRPFTASTRRLSRWVSITLRLQNGCLPHATEPLPIALDHEGVRAQAGQSQLDQVRNLLLRTCDDNGTVNIDDPAARAALREEILQSVTQLLEASDWSNDRHVGRPQVSRSKVIARCLELIDASEGQPLFIDDLCQATQVSERTLRNVFQEFFGVGPMRLLKVRQLREIRSALLRADPAVDTVTRVAGRFGVWDFSLFARNYRALYAEAPSVTLRRPHQTDPEYRREDDVFGATWMGYAARRFMPAGFAAPTGEMSAAEGERAG